MTYECFSKELMDSLMYKNQLIEKADVTDQWEPLMEYINEHPSWLEVFEFDEDLGHR